MFASARMTIYGTSFWLILAFGILWIAGVWTAFKPGMILGPLADRIEWVLKKWFTKEQSDYICKPLFTCPPCCASLHGTYVWFIAGGDWMMWLPYCICLCGANSFLFIVFQDE